MYSQETQKHYGGGALLLVIIAILIVLLLWWALRRNKDDKHHKRSRSHSRSDECDKTSESRSARYSSDSKSRYSGSGSH